ncbi:unnamed protein product [Triticum turgidum subsp. durum]|uniref:protein-serine/threonine phosphatase n=1 Tax=Triticum turgidum subsp. durum TaxID=4567 RepID=A0A9R0UX52_TRITD|nr:unnamed protein product [Triticum turgidum subsp. durum]
MRQISSMLQGLARSMSLGKERKQAEEAQGTVLRSSGTLWGEGSETLAAACSRRGEKGTNQDTSIVWEGYGCQDDTIFCGVFDGHGQWGHYVAKAVRESLPQRLLCRWQEAVALASLIDGEKRLGDCQFDLLRQSYLAAAPAVDDELRRSRRLDAVNSGCTALSIVKQGDLMVVANVGDSRAVLATTSDDGDVTAVQLTVDFKPDLPREGAHHAVRGPRALPRRRARRAPGVGAPPGGAGAGHVAGLRRLLRQGLRRDLGAGGDAEEDHRPGPVRHPRHRRVWDVLSNEEAVRIVAATPDREKAAKRLVECAVRGWRRKRRGVAVDDCSAVCLFFHTPAP